MARIFHFTHRDNLAGILAARGLHCNSDMNQNGYNNVGNRDIKNRRFRCRVTVEPFGVVADYVPFYFAPRSPMLYSIHGGYVQDCSYGQDEVVYLVCETDDVFGVCKCCFTDINAAKSIANFYNEKDKMDDIIDWPLMRAIYWNNSDDDTNRKDRRMAEFLIHKEVPTQFIRGIGAYDARNKN